MPGRVFVAHFIMEYCSIFNLSLKWYFSELEIIFMITEKDRQIIDFIRKETQVVRSKYVLERYCIWSYATLKRMLTKLVAERCIVIEGQGKGNRYFLSYII